MMTTVAKADAAREFFSWKRIVAVLPMLCSRKQVIRANEPLSVIGGRPRQRQVAADLVPAPLARLPLQQRRLGFVEGEKRGRRTLRRD
jgi:hypothetical protein